MRLNRSTDYAIRVVLCLAKEERAISSSKLSRMVGVSPRYLLQIGARLRGAGLIATTYGPTGGFSLLRAPREISLYDIIAVMEGHISNKKDPEDRDELAEVKILNAAYGYVDTVLNDILKSITIESLLAQSIEKWYLAPCLMTEK